MPDRLNIAVVMELNWPFTRHFITNQGISDYANEHTNWLLDQCDYPELFIKKGVHYDGIIGRISSACYKEAIKHRIPMVNVWLNSPVVEQIPSSLVNFTEAGQIAAEHLVARGFKRLIHIGYNDDNASSAHYEGVRSVAEKYGYPCYKYHLSLQFDESSQGWTEFLASVQTFQKNWEAPIGLALVTDSLARPILSILTYLGWKIPQQLAIVGTGNNELICKSLNPTLSTINLGHYQSGYDAAGLLDKLLKGQSVSLEKRYIPCKELIVQQSSDVYAVDDPVVARALEYMSNNSNSALSVDNVAQKVGMGRRTLERRFKKLLDRTINDELIRLRIERLKRLLLETDAPVKTLCSDVGFGTNVHMHNIFKRYTGMTPTAFRNKHKHDKAINPVDS